MSRFPSTQWSLVQSLGEADIGLAREALAVICRVYWRPVYGAVLRSGCSHEDASDLTQDFFVHLIDNDGFRRVDRSKGRFRTFLLACLRNFLSKERARRSAQKRSPSRPLVAIDAILPEERLRLEPADTLTPDEVFEQQWAATVVGRAVERLEQSQARVRSRIPFAHLQAVLMGDDTGLSYRDIAVESGSTEAAVKMAVHRLRERFGKCLRAEVEPTVAAADQVDDELRYLLDRFTASGMSLAGASPATAASVAAE